MCHSDEQIKFCWKKLTPTSFQAGFWRNCELRLFTDCVTFVLVVTFYHQELTDVTRNHVHINRYKRKLKRVAKILVDVQARGSMVYIISCIGGDLAPSLGGREKISQSKIAEWLF